MESSKVVYINEEDDIEEHRGNTEKKEIIKDNNIKNAEDIAQHEDTEDYVDDEEYLKVTDLVSEGGDISDNESVNTMDILNIDPLYLRLTKFLQSNEGESVADTLKKIHEQLVLLNTKLEK